MQMNGSGIICTGYLLYNPSDGNIGTISGRSYSSGDTVTKSTSAAPGIGQRLCYKAQNTGSYEIYLNVTFTSGTYTPAGGIGTVTGITDKVRVAADAYENRKLPYVRYA